jgi:PHP domain-containing protein
MCGREARGVPRLTRRRLLELAAAGTAATVLPRAAFARSATRPGAWIAGDLHSHTVLSHDVWGGPGDDNTPPDQAYTLGWTAGDQISIAESRGLDFLAITDHNRTDALFLPEYASSKLTLLPAYEHSLSGGHAGVFVPNRNRLNDVVKDVDGSTGFAGDEAVARFLDDVHALGGLAILNHPFYGNANQGVEIAWGYGVEVSSRFDAVEVWNIGWPARHDTIPFADSDDYLSLPWWEREILSRRKVPAVGGSDNHWRSTTAAQGVGQPTTWVFTNDRSPGGILKAIRAGRTFIAAEPPGMAGPTLWLTARENWPRGRQAMVGDEVRGHGPLQVTVEVHNGTGSRLRLVSLAWPSWTSRSPAPRGRRRTT